VPQNTFGLGIIEHTWLLNPMPTPRSNRPMISIAIFIAHALITALEKKLIDPQSIHACTPAFTSGHEGC